MNAPLRSPLKSDIQTLIKVIKQSESTDAFTPGLTLQQWDLLVGYLQPFALSKGQKLIE